MNDAELNKTADIGFVRKLYRDGLLSDDAYTAASGLLRPASIWFSWVRQMLLLYGSALVLVGIIYFFAYNWASLGKFAKFGLIETAIVVCIIGSYARGRKKLSGKIFLLSGSVLVGVLLAVYGQIYQTGADPFELFVGWSALIFGWVIISEFAALWFLWLTLLNIGAILYWGQVGWHTESIQFGLFCLAVAALNGAVLALREVGVLRGIEWLSGRWYRGILFASLLFALSCPTFILIVDWKSTGGWSIVAALMWAITAVAGYVCYRLKLRDMIPIALIAMNACFLFLTLIGWNLLSGTGLDPAGVFFLFALIIIAVVAGAAFWLRETAAKMQNEIKESAV